MKAAVPSTTRAAPAASARRIDAIERRPPPNSTGTSSSRGDPLDVVQVGRLALARAVEVDHVQEARARLDERARGLERVVGVDGLVVEVALAQPDGLAVADVHRRQEDHARRARTKFFSRRSPSGPDFSGWDCSPYTGGRSTTLTNSLPYSAVPSTCLRVRRPRRERVGVVEGARVGQARR